MKKKRTVSAQYSASHAGSLADRVAAKMRRVMYSRFLTLSGVSKSESILDVGVTSDEELEASNYLEAWYPVKSQITCCGVDEGARFLEKRYPGVTYVAADGRQLPFADHQFDVVHSSAVIEHVGSRLEQRQFVLEAVRVARRAVFITTPNRWFPIEFHSILPFVHWLPSRFFRGILRFLGHETLSQERNLNLLARRELIAMCDQLSGYSTDVYRVRLFGWTSNLLLCIVKGGTKAGG